MNLRPAVICWMLLMFGWIAVGFLLKPAQIVGQNGSSRVLFWRYEKGTIRFVNSVTLKPVTIHFRVRGQFSDFSMETDEETENYYTSGTYAIDPVLSRQKTSSLKLCSIHGIALSVGDDRWEIQDGCVEVTLLWTF